MKKIEIVTKGIILLLFISIDANSQFAIINDKDGFTNVRERKNSDSKILGRLYNEDVFLYDTYSYRMMKNELDAWVSIFQNIALDRMEPYKRDFYIKELHSAKNNFICHGYIQKSVLIPLENLEKISTKNLYLTNEGWSIKDDSIYLINDTLSLLIKTGKFNPDEHKIERRYDGIIEKIDGIRQYGVWDDIPKIEIKNITFKINSESIDIPEQEYKFCFQPQLRNLSLLIDEKGLIYVYIPGNSDGAPGYLVVWIIKGHKYLKRYIDNY